MIKKTLILLSVTVLVISCDKKQIQNATSGVDTTVVNKADSLVDNAHNSHNSLTVEGIYTGVIPCTDCEGIETHVELKKDYKYTLRKKYLKKEDQKSVEFTGTYTWNKTGDIITLDNDLMKFKVGEDKLIQLDEKGDIIAGDLAPKYFLVKEK